MVANESYPVSLIAIMGVTGSGKTSFANLASGSDDLKVGTDLNSCTSEIQLSKPFTLDGRKVVLIDTPGFNDTEISDSEVLRMITAFLERTYEKGVRLTGIIYFHRISDERFTGMDVRNFGVFRKLCGEQTLKNVVVMTNMWGNVTPEVGDAREQQLSTVFFKLAIEGGAQSLRHVKTTESAHAVIRAILNNHPLALQIQEELVDQRMEFSRTAAGEEIHRTLNEHAEKLEDKIKELQSALEAAEKRERETRQELEEEVRRLRERLDSVRSESMQLETRYRERRDEMQSKTDTLMGDLLKTLVGVFKMGFFSGLVLAALLGLGFRY